MTPILLRHIAGLTLAADMARAAAAEIRARPRPKDFGEREQKASIGALEALAISIEEAIAPPAPPAVVVKSSPPKGPLSPETSVALGAMADAARTHLRAKQEAGEKAALAIASLVRGYTGDECRECGNFTLVRNGTCLKCETCGSTTGCS